MTVNEETIQTESVEVASLRSKVFSGVVGVYRLVRTIIEEGNTLTISAEQAALAAPESYAKIRARIKMNTLIGYEYLIMNILATIIASCGLALNSMLAIFGAGAIAMLLDPIMGASLAIVEGDRKLFVQALYAEIVGGLIVLVTSFVFAIIYHYHVTNLPEGFLIQYATPNLLDLIMAIACGAACAYSALSRKLRVGLGGVVLSITLMPPLAACGIFLAHGSLSLASGSLLSYLTNFVGIQFTASVVFWLHGFKSDVDSDLNVAKIFKKNIASVFIILILAVVLGLNLKHILDRQRYEQAVKVVLRNNIDKIPGTDLANISIGRNNVITVVVRSLDEIGDKQVQQVVKGLPRKSGKAPELHMRVVKAHEITVTG